MVTLNESALFIGHDDDERRRRFEKHGMLLMPNVFNPQELRTIRQCFTSHVSQDRSLDCDDQVPDHDILKKYPRFVQPHRHLDTAPGVLAKKHLVDTRLWTAVENLIGPAHGAQLSGGWTWGEVEKQRWNGCPTGDGRVEGRFVGTCWGCRDGTGQGRDSDEG